MCPLKNRGFTLVEVMIAAAILALIMGIVYGSFSGSLKTMEISKEDGEAYRKARIILNRMAQEISCASLPSEQSRADIAYAFIGEDREEDGSPQDSLHFISTAVPLKEPMKGLKEVGYYVTSDTQTGEHTLIVREDTTPDDRSDQGGKRYVLGSNVWGLDLKYYDEEGREWERWDSTSPLFENRLPKMVKVSLVLKDERSEAISLTTRTYIPLEGD
jgi:general secretion pathway protein J